MSVRLTKAAADKLVGRDIPTDLFDFNPTGHRIIVAREAPEGKRRLLREDGSETFLHIPVQAQRVPTKGWIIACGEQVGTPCPDWPHQWPFDPQTSCGMKVMFGDWVGSTLLVGDVGENDYESLYSLVTAGDLWGYMEAR